MQTDFPIIQAAVRLEGVQRRFPNSPVCEAAMLRARTVHEFAIAYLALWRYKGEKPISEYSNKMISDAIKLVDDVLLSMRREMVGLREIKPVERLRVYNKVQHRLTTSVEGIDGGYIMPLSDEARRQARLWREEHGSTYKGARMTRKREHCKTGDARYPLHWVM